ncbi:MAG: Rossmann-like and DUF2520 domain-containing protein [Bacteroidales bacterium]|nr:Rossmann-like and DUF2520 domain-containing protein [Bacteroidales bacterium]
MTTTKQTISFVGSGNVATHLALALKAAGHQILQVFSREYDHAERLAHQVFAEPIDKLALLYPTADVYVLAVSDDALFDLALDLRLREALVVHTSGTVPMKVLEPISRKCGVAWSPQTFVREVAMQYDQLPFCIEGSTPQVEQQIAALMETVSQKIFRLNSEQRQWLHLSAVMVSNFGNALNALAQEQLERHDLPFDVLTPLIQTTAEKALHGDLWSLQTGPARRRDQKTIDRHRQMLLDQPRLKELYELFTQIIQER